MGRVDAINRSIQRTGDQPGLPFANVGIGLRPRHYRDLLESRQPVGFLEAHAENFLVERDLHSHALESLRKHYPLSLHCIGLSLGSATGVSREHLCRLGRLVDRVDPFLVSDHLSWSAVGGLVVNELLPLPFTRAALAIVASNVARTQDFLRRPILIENIAAYFRFRGSDMHEAEFLNSLAANTGCKILLDLTNLHVNQCNHGEDGIDTMLRIEARHIGQFHLAGHLVTPSAVIDNHGAVVSDESWELYVRALIHAGLLPTVVEWDQDVPHLDVLVDQARIASALCHKAGVAAP